MVAAALGKSGAERFRIGYVSGLTHYLVSLYWLLLIPYKWHGLPLGPATGWLALGAFLALGPASWVWLVSTLAQPVPIRLAAAADPLGDPAEAELVRPSRFGDLAGELIPATWGGRTLWALGAAAAWVALEMVLARVFGGFPWNLLGASQYQMIPLIQIASVTGVYGVSFLMVWFSLGVVCAALTVLRRPATRSLWMAELFLPLLAGATPHPRPGPWL
jgi:apolipoprotein N-acyltransferase